MTKWTHDSLQHDLVAHLASFSDRAIWEDMQLGPAGSPRPDVYTVPKSFAKFRPIAYEIKISTSDFRRDITAGKWQSYLKYASGVIFAVPKGLIGRDDVPTGCGLITRGESGWHAVKGPTLKVLDGLPQDTWLKLVMDGIERQRREAHVRVADGWRTAAALRASHGDLVADVIRNAGSVQTRIDARLKEADDRYRALVSRGEDEARRSLSHIEKPLNDLRKALGLPDDANAWDVASHLREALTRVNASTEVARLRRQLERTRDAVLDGLAELLPAQEAAHDA